MQTGITMRTRHKSRNKLTTLERHTLSRTIRHSPEFSSEANAQLPLGADDIEFLTGEDNIWEGIERIKSMTIPMTQKRGVKMRILNQQRNQLGSYDQFQWQKRKLTTTITNNLQDWLSRLELWHNDMKLIEGHYGSGVKAYFQFLKWLFNLNIMILILILSFVSIPSILMETMSKPKNGSTCASKYHHNVTHATFNVLDLFQGTGYMEKTFLFYGSYPNAAIIQDVPYNLPLAYLLVTLTYMLISLISIIKTAVKGFRERLVIDEGGRFHLYCNLVFTSWDFCIHNEKSAMIKHRAIYNEIKACLESERLEKKRKSKTQNVKKIMLIRTFINIIVLGILAACGYGIYYVFQKTYGNSFSRSDGENTYDSQRGAFLNLIYEFLPSITIVSMNMVVPLLFQYLITFETYSPLVTIRLTLVRTVFLRLASLIVLYVSLYNRVTDSDGILVKECKCSSGYSKILCCETIVGQQIYKLLLTDFATQVFTTFFINYGRHRLAKTYNKKIFKLIGEQNFDLPRHVLDVVYTQSLCWLGCFYAPLLSAVMVIFSFLTFYMKKFACIVNSKPSATIYRVSRSNSMFMVVTLISYIVAVLPVIYSIGLLEPSKSCGPFRDFPTVWKQIDHTFTNIHPITREIFKFLCTPGFVVPLLILLILMLYYYTAVSNANRHMVTVLKKQLVLEGQDKRFLLDRLEKFIRQQYAEGDIFTY